MEPCDSESVPIRARMDNRGRITIKEDDRIALGLDDLSEGDRALLELDATVVKRIPEDDRDD